VTTAGGPLNQWRAEMAAGVRGDSANWHTWRLDELWRAACWEQAERESRAEFPAAVPESPPAGGDGWGQDSATTFGAGGWS